MKNLKLLLALTIGLGILGFVVSKNGRWLRGKLFCTSCCSSKSCSNSTPKNFSNGNNESYTINIASDSSGEPLARFAPANDIKLEVIIQDNPVLTDKYLEKKIAETYGQMLQQDVSLKNLPKQQLKLFFDHSMQIEGVRRAELANILASEENRKKLANHIDQALTGFVMTNIYEKAKEKAKVSPDDLLAEYENNKSRFIKDLGGIRIIAAKYESKDDAEQQLTLMSDKDISTVVDFAREVKDNDGTEGQIKDFGYVSKDFPRGAALQIVEAAESFAEYPSLDIVTISENEHWLLMATEAKDATYYSFEECKQRISAMLEQQSIMKAVNDALAKGAQESKAEMIQNSYFDDSVDSIDNQNNVDDEEEALRNMLDDANNAD